MSDSDKSSFIEHWNTANSLTYPILKDKRKVMRDNMTPAEERLWEEIKSKKLGVKFRRQHIIGNYIPDFVAISCKLISRALKSLFSYYIIVDLVKHSFYQVNNLYFKFEPKR